MKLFTVSFKFSLLISNFLLPPRTIPLFPLTLPDLPFPEPLFYHLLIPPRPSHDYCFGVQSTTSRLHNRSESRPLGTVDINSHLPAQVPARIAGDWVKTNLFVSGLILGNEVFTVFMVGHTRLFELNTLKNPALKIQCPS